jgi:predicted amidohydrolase YtcJ
MMPRRNFAASVANSLTWGVCLFFLGTLSYAQQGPVDLILHNGKVMTVDSNFSTAQAVAVTGNTITAVGSNADILRLRGPNTQVIDVKGRTVTPGMMDTHRHYNADGSTTEQERRSFRVDWGAVKTKDDVLSQIAGIIQKEKIPAGQWIHFRNTVGFMGEATPTTVLHAKILFNELNRWELDKVAPNNPIIMTEGIPEYNGLLINGVAMDILWKEYGDFIKENGRYWVDSSGRPDGHLESVATRPVMMVYTPRPSAEAQAPGFRRIQESEAAIGLTVVSARYPKYRVESLRLLESRGQLIQRVAYGLEDVFGVIKDVSELKNYTSEIGKGTDKIWIVSISPSSVDGSGSRMCTNQSKQGKGAIDNFYPVGQCYQDAEFRGAAGKAAAMSKNYYQDWIMASAQYGIRFANTHMSGDRSNALFLKYVGEAQAKFGPTSTRNWASDHCDLINPADLDLAAKLGVRFSCYPNAVNDGAEVAANYGENVANTFAAPLKTMVDKGISISYEGEGAPHVWAGLYSFLTRKDEDGNVWGPQEKIDRATALRMATMGGAEYILKPDKFGSIEKGKIADLLVLDRDFMTIPDDDVPNVRPLITVFDGKISYVHKQFSDENNLKPAGAVISTYDDLRRALAGAGFGGG